MTTSFKILTYPNASLLTPSQEWDFSRFDSRDKLIDIGLQMGEILRSMPNGAALAANQVGVPYRMFVLRDEIAEENKLPTIIVNPKIRPGHHGTVSEREGCLSFPGIQIDIKRYVSVMADYITIDGDKRTDALCGFIGRVFQHECEHLDGKTFLEGVHRVDKFRIMAEMKKRKMRGG